MHLVSLFTSTFCVCIYSCHTSQVGVYDSLGKHKKKNEANKQFKRNPYLWPLWDFWPQQHIICFLSTLPVNCFYCVCRLKGQKCEAALIDAICGLEFFVVMILENPDTVDYCKAPCIFSLFILNGCPDFSLSLSFWVEGQLMHID